MNYKHIALIAGLLAAVASGATVVLQINGTEVTDYALGRAKKAVVAMQKGQEADEATVLKGALDQVIGHVLLVQAAREAGVTVDPADVQRRVAAVRSRYASRDAFARALADGGTSEAEMTRYEEENLLLQRYTETVLAPRVKVAQDEVSAYYRDHPTEFDHPEQVKVRMILVEVAKGAGEEAERNAKARIDRAASRLAEGEPFEKVASEVSDDAGRSKGGEVGWVRRGLLLPQLDEEVFKLEVGQHTKPIRTEYGYHIMGAAERRPAGRSPFAEVEANLTGMLKSMKVRDLLGAEVASRRARAKFETLDPAIRAALQL